MTTPLQSFYIVRFNDCDPLGHLNNARYIDYMLNAREDHLRDEYQVLLPDFAKQGVTWVTTNHEIQYVRPALYSERVCIQSALIESSESQLIVEIVMYDESIQQIKALLWTTFTHINIKTGRKAVHDPEFFRFLKGITVTHVNKAAGLKARLAELFVEANKRNENDFIN